MTEPPASEPPAEPTGELAPGWYPDPEGGTRQAYWNGRDWRRPAAATAQTPTAENPAPASGRPGWLVPVIAAVVALVVVAGVAFFAMSRHSSSTTAGSGGGSGGAAAGPQATGPRVGTNGVTVVLPDGWEAVPADDAGFKTWADAAAKTSPDVVAAMTKARAATSVKLSVLAVPTSTDGTYKTFASVTANPPAGTDAATVATAVETTLSATLHDVSVQPGTLGSHQAVTATYDYVSALVPPQGAQAYVLDSSASSVVTVTTWDTIDPLAIAKQIGASVAFG